MSKKFQMEIFDIPITNRSGNTEYVLRKNDDDTYTPVPVNDEIANYPIRISEGEMNEDNERYVHFIDFSEGPLLYAGSTIGENKAISRIFTSGNKIKMEIKTCCTD